MKIATYSELDLKNHIFLQQSDEINQILKPLVDNFGLNSFNFHKTYHDNAQIRLTNTPSWCYEYLTDKYYQESIFELPAHNYQKNRYIWSNIHTHKRILAGARAHGINYGITFVEPVDDGCEFYFIGTLIDNPEIINHYLSNFRLLEKFVATFHKKAAHLFEKIEPRRVIVEDWQNNQVCYNPAVSVDNLKYLAEISEYHFTARELDCVPGLLKGHSAKQVAENLQISFRTVETHINNLKQKTATASKDELLRVLHRVFSC